MRDWGDGAAKQIDKVFETVGEIYDQLEACGCTLTAETTLVIIDRELAVAWFERALAEFDSEQAFKDQLGEASR